jgi:hypothetical protein
MTAYLRDDVGKTALKRKSIAENPLQAAPVRFSRSRLRTHNIGAGVLSR